uniref:Lipoprotein n=1 Tax=Desulfomonile tiedjei TaxID=2358 RepID=A0A7C4EUA5_9BACT
MAKFSLPTVFVATALVAVMVIGCVPGFRSAKPVSTQGQTQSPGQAGAGTDATLKPLPPPPPDYVASKEKETGGDMPELLQKEEINQAALKFAKEIPNVKYIKTCFSKIYGGWYLLLYVEKGKKISLQQYSWNEKSKEWDVVYQVKEVPASQLEYHLKGEVGDEKCFLLKK